MKVSHTHKGFISLSCNVTYISAHESIIEREKSGFTKTSSRAMFFPDELLLALIGVDSLSINLTGLRIISLLLSSVTFRSLFVFGLNGQLGLFQPDIPRFGSKSLVQINSKLQIIGRSSLLTYDKRKKKKIEIFKKSCFLGMRNCIYRNNLEYFFRVFSCSQHD